MRLNVVERESLQCRTGQAELRRLLGGTVVVPLVDQHALDHPHGRRAVAAGAMDECRLRAGFGNSFHEAICHRREFYWQVLPLLD